MRVLGIESSCDETGLAIYDSNDGVLAEVLHSQSDLHARYGGVVPELASRDHVRRILPLLHQLLGKAHLDIGDIDAVAYTAGPGLVGALLVGASFARALAYARDIPALAVHHMEGHLLVSLLNEPAPSFPFVALLVSGGHTMLLRADGVGDYQVLGNSCDDAAGEAFDKVAKLLGLTYPGGAALAAMAERGNHCAVALPRPMTLPKGGLNFSFSGLKTCVAQTVRDMKGGDGTLADTDRADIAASFQEAVVDTIVYKCLRALDSTGLSQLVIAGGVAANTRLRTVLTQKMRDIGAQVFCPPQSLCTDNGLMIAYAGWLRWHASEQHPKSGGAETISVYPRWSMETLGV